MITGKTIGQLTELYTMTPDTLIPVEFSGSTYYASHSILTSSSSFSSRITNLVSDSGSFSTRATTLETASSSFSTRVTSLVNDSGSFSTRVTNLVSDSGSFSTRLTTDSSSISSLSSASGSFSTRVTTLETASGSFSTRVTNLVSDSSSLSTRTSTLESASGSFSTRVTNLVTDSSSFSTRLTTDSSSISSLSNASASFSTRVTNLVTDSSSFSTRITYFTGSVFGTSSKVVNGVYTTDTGSVSNDMLAGNIANSKLVNSSILIGTSSVSLGATASSLTGLDNLSANSVTVSGQPTTYGYVNSSYLFAYNNADQSSVGQNVAVNFQVTSVNNGSLITKTSNSQITLAAGNTYILKAVIGRLTSSSTWAQFKWYDVTNGVYVGAEGFSEVVNSSGAVGSTNVPTAYVTPNVNTTYELRQTTVNTITVNAYASMEVVQVNPAIAVQATATGTVNTDYAIASPSTTQTITTAPTTVTFGNISGSGISLSGGGFALTAGKTYQLEAVVGGGFNTTAYIYYAWVDGTNAFIAGGSVGGGFKEGSTNSDVANPVAFAIYTPVSNTTVYLRVLTISGGTLTVQPPNSSPNWSSTYAKITQVGSIFALNALNTMTLTGALTATGSITSVGNVSGNTLISTNASGAEGGEIQLAKAPTSTLSGSNVTIDQYADRIRIFENSGSFKGAYIDLSQAAIGVGTMINNRVSGLVNAGTYVTMDFIKATVTTSGNRGLSLAATTGSFSAQIGSNYSVAGGTGGATTSGTINTTPSTSQFNYMFYANDISTYIITDTTNSRAYRITLQIGASYNNNMICIERLLQNQPYLK